MELGFFFIVTFFVFLYVLSRWRKDNERRKTEAADFRQLFYEAVQYFLYKRFDPHDLRAQRYNSAFMRTEYGTYIRNIQIIRDSIDIVMSTSKKDTAESRVATINECGKVIAQLAYMVPLELRREIQTVVDADGLAIKTKVYVNIANAHIEKSLKAKTQKTKLKYLLLALDILEEGFTEPESDKAVLQALKNETLSFMAELKSG